MTRLTKAMHENQLERSLKRLVYPKVLILDELSYLPLSRNEASLFFRLVTRRYERASLIVTSNKSFLDWDEFLNDPLLASAGIVRLCHRAEIVILRGDSFRAQGRQSLTEEVALEKSA